MSEYATDPEANDSGGEWMGHPKGLFYCFFAEMWERFCFYGMRNVLVLYMVSHFMYEESAAQSGPYASYTALIYCVAIFGGFVADRYIGYRTSIMFGGILMSAGMIMFMLNSQILGWVGVEVSRGVEDFFFFAGMATIIVGNGYFKPNISTLVGKIYAPGDPRRDSGFTIFYMGINIGALVGGLACGWIGETVAWPLGFGLAALFMLAGVFTFGTDSCRNSLMGHGEAASEETKKRAYPLVILASLALIPVFYFLLQNSAVVGWILGLTGAAMVGYMLLVAFKESKKQREMIFALLILVGFNPVFWAMFEQAGGSLTLYANSYLDRDIFGWFEMPASVVQQFNAAFIILMAPILAWLWVKMARGGVEPSIPLKFALGLFQLGLGILVLVIGSNLFTPEDGKTPLMFMVGLYFLITMGELCLSPVGLSMITKLAPERMTGMVMGLWFLSIASANFLAGQIGALTGADRAEEGAGRETYTDIYTLAVYVIGGATVLLLALTPLLKKWTHGIK